MLESKKPSKEYVTLRTLEITDVQEADEASEWLGCSREWKYCPFYSTDMLINPSMVSQVPVLHSQWWMYWINTCKTLPNNFFVKTGLLQGRITSLSSAKHPNRLTIPQVIFSSHLVATFTAAKTAPQIPQPLFGLYDCQLMVYTTSYHLTGWNQDRRVLHILYCKDFCWML